MATHKEVVKVWIAPGCIVCDACETECPEVFDVQEETCVIRPAAKDANFTKGLTPTILSAAEGCPVEVIKFETVEVEGPEPWAGKEPAAPAAAAGGAAAPAKKAAAPVSSGPPDPRWAGLLKDSRTSGSRSAGGPAVTVRAARAPAEAVSAALPKDAPPDAVAAAVVGSGFVGNRPTVADTIRQKAGLITSAAQITRRGFSLWVGIGWLCIGAVAATFGGALQSFLIPKVTKEPPSSFRAGRVSDYPDPGVYETYKNSNKVWIVRLPDNKIVAISTICTHLGCIPNWLKGDDKFKCPCHGSGFYRDGVNFEGPAPRPLERFKVSVENDVIIVDMSQKYRAELAQWDLPGAFLAV